MQVRVVTNITKEYPDMIKVVIYKQPKVYVRRENTSKRTKEQVSEDYTPAISSLSRTKTLVKDLVLCNDFELFCTFTFNPKKIETHNLSRCWQRMSTWLHHQSAKTHDLGGEFKYLIIPEQHKSGAWHFHALISGYNGSLRSSGLFSASARPIYNITSFRSGFTTAVEIDSKEAVSNYVTKYITKDFVKTFNQRRFFCSRNLVRPIRTLNSPLFSMTLPIFRKKLADYSETEEYMLFPVEEQVKATRLDNIKLAYQNQLERQKLREKYF